MDIEMFLPHIEALIRELPAFAVVVNSGRAALRGEYNPHVHPGWELKELACGELQLVPPGTPHETTGICPWSLEVGAEFVTLGFGGRFHFLNRPVERGVNLLPELFALLVRVPEDAALLREQLLRSALVAVEMLVAALERTPKEPEDLYTLAVDCLRRNYYKREFSVDDLAAISGVSPQYLNRLFHRNGNVGVRRKLIEIRLEKARELLESGNYLVSDAARLTGWSCPFYFCNSFKRHYGVPPVAVRR